MVNILLKLFIVNIHHMFTQSQLNVKMMCVHTETNIQQKNSLVSSSFTTSGKEG